jgi:hypothetical protein
LLYDAFNQVLIGYGWLGNPLFLVGLTGVAFLFLWLGYYGVRVSRAATRQTERRV